MEAEAIVLPGIVFRGIVRESEMPQVGQSLLLNDRFARGGTVGKRIRQAPRRRAVLASLCYYGKIVAGKSDRPNAARQPLKRGALTAGMERQAHPTRLKRLGRHKSYGPLGEYLEFGDLFAEHPLDGIS